MPEPRQEDTDLLPLARGLTRDGHRVALLDSPPGTQASRYSHLCLLDEPLLDTTPSPGKEHVCLATYDHGLKLHGIKARHEPELGFHLASYPVKARLTLDRHTGRLQRTGDPSLLNAQAVAEPASPLQARKVRFNHTQDSFTSMVEDAKAYIRAGHTYQVNLSLRATMRLDGDPTSLFDTLRSINPSPYQALLSTPEVTLVSASPELLLDVQARHARTRPIAGTRPRGGTPREDARLERELHADAKERAEHAMLVDLARNDLGRVARYGTVTVSDDALIERYSHVMHLVSEVQATLREDATAWDAFEAIFPCGTITGAPKHRSMAIIDELEAASRGAYTGSLGLVTPRWSTWNILIRTLVLRDDHAHVQAGAGIVADSDPPREHEECLAKAQALLEALDLDPGRSTAARLPGGAPWT